MKRFVFSFLLLCGTMAQAQEYVTCNTYNDYNDFEKAKLCLNSLESRFAKDPAFYYYKMQQAISSKDQVTAKKLMDEVGAFPANDFHVLSAKTSYLVFTQDIPLAKATYESVLKNHKLAPVAVILNVARTFISFKTRDADYTLLWLNTLEKELKQPHAGWLMLKGDYYYSLSDYGNALNNYNLVIDAEPGNALAYYKKAVSYGAIKNPTAALNEIEVALKLRPDFPAAILEKGETLLELHRYDEGKIAYEQYFKLVPGDNLAHLRYGSALFSMKKYEEARMEAELVLKNDENNISAKKLKAYSLYELQQYVEGQAVLLNYMAVIDTAAITYRDYDYLAHFYIKNGSDSLAIETFKKGLTYQGATSEAFSEAGSLMVKKNHYADALVTYQAKLLLYNGSSADYYNYGRSALALEDYVLADSLFAKVCEMQPLWPNGFLMRANANAHLDPGSTSGKALPYYEQFVMLAEADVPNAAKYKSGLMEAYRYLGYFHYLSKNIEKSKFYWKKVLELDPNDKQAKDVMKQL